MSSEKRQKTSHEDLTALEAARKYGDAAGKRYQEQVEAFDRAREVGQEATRATLRAKKHLEETQNWEAAAKAAIEDAYQRLEVARLERDEAREYLLNVEQSRKVITLMDDDDSDDDDDDSVEEIDSVSGSEEETDDESEPNPGKLKAIRQQVAALANSRSDYVIDSALPKLVAALSCRPPYMEAFLEVKGFGMLAKLLCGLKYKEVNTYARHRTRLVLAVLETVYKGNSEALIAVECIADIAKLYARSSQENRTACRLILDYLLACPDTSRFMIQYDGIKSIMSGITQSVTLFEHEDNEVKRALVDDVLLDFLLLVSSTRDGLNALKKASSKAFTNVLQKRAKSKAYNEMSNAPTAKLEDLLRLLG